jgi:TRAP-type transport system periplasmic protein
LAASAAIEAKFDRCFSGGAAAFIGDGRMKPILLGLSALLLANGAIAQEATLKAVTVFTENTTYSRPFERFINRVNEDGKGVLRINYIGGPKAMPPFEIGNALKGGVIDIANTAGAFYTNLMPEADAWKLTERSMPELRQNGGYDAMAAIYAQKVNAIFLARLVDNNPFHLYLNKPISSPDLTGFKLRITPVYRDFFQALGGTVVQTAPGEVYTALERGVVDGYGWPISGIFDLGWNEKTKYRVDPGFYTAEVSVLVNRNSWDRLSEAQKNVLRKSAERGEAEAVAEFAEENERETRRQAAAGIQTIKFEGATASAYLAKAYQAGWDGIIRQSATAGPKLKEFFQKPR